MGKKCCMFFALCLWLFVSSSSAQYNSGWKYVQNVKFQWSNGGYSVLVALSNTIGGDATVVLSIGILGDESLMQLVSKFERAQNENLKVAFRNESRSDVYVLPGNTITLDVVR